MGTWPCTYGMTVPVMIAAATSRFFDVDENGPTVCGWRTETKNTVPGPSNAG